MMSKMRSISESHGDVSTEELDEALAQIKAKLPPKVELHTFSTFDVSDFHCRMTVLTYLTSSRSLDNATDLCARASPAYTCRAPK